LGKVLEEGTAPEGSSIFRSMEDNIRNSLLRQQLIPGIPHLHGENRPQEPLATPPSQIRVRTISAMNNFIVGSHGNSSEDKNNSYSSNNRSRSLRQTTTPSSTKQQQQ
jgi:activator of HSP90 ATPase